MPAIVIKDYTWRQTSEFVLLNVPVRGNPRNINFFVIDSYTKISFPPFILELFLWANVNEKESKCTVTDQEIVLSLKKTDDLTWPALEIQNIDKEAKREYRNRALERAQTVAEDRAKIKSEKRQLLQKEAVREQIDINTGVLNRIDAVRNAHRKEAMREFEDWRSRAEIPILRDVEGKIQENRKAYKPPLKWFRDDDNTLKSREILEEEILDSDPLKQTAQSNKIKEIECNVPKATESLDNQKIVEIESENVIPEARATEKNKNDCEFDSSSSEDSDSDLELKFEARCSIKEVEEEKEKDRPGLEAVKAAINGKMLERNNIFAEPSKSVPLPRKNGVINVTFSERQFPTPARESCHLEEQEWLQKQAEARRKIGFATEDLRPEERDPQWLKDKGDEFFKVGNHLAAISAYSYGIKISDKMVSLYVNRSAAHYALENYCRCIEDCSTALELMVPKCESNRESRARCHARRGAALCKLSAPQNGIPELEAALELTPDNESIKRDVRAAKQYFDIKD